MCASYTTTASPQPRLQHVVVIGRTEEPPDPETDPASPFANAPGPPVAWAEALGPIVVENSHTGGRASVRLYLPDGEVDPDALDDFERCAGDGDGPAPLDPRVVMLAIKAAYFNGARDIVIVSAYRSFSHGRHGVGEALDFRLRGLDARALAAHLRGYPRAGVGIYTHPRTQFVHLDVRTTSFHWRDGSPPGVTWPEIPLADEQRAARDGAYRAENDLPL